LRPATTTRAARELRGDPSRRAGRAEDQDPLPRGQLALDHERLPGGPAGVEERGGGHVVDAVGNREPRARAHQCLLGHPAVGRLRAEEPDPGPVFQVAHPVQLGDLGKSGGPAARDLGSACPLLAVIRSYVVEAVRHPPVGRFQRRRGDPHHGLAVTGRRRREQLIARRLADGLQHGCVHLMGAHG